MHGHMIATAGPAFVMVLTAIAALLFLVRDWRIALVGALLMSLAFATTTVLALRAGWHLPVVAAILTALLAAMARAGFDAWRHRRERDRLRLGFAGYVSPPVLEAILAGRIEPGHRPTKRLLAFVFADLRGSTALTAGVAPEEAMALLNRFHEVMVAATHRHDGFLDNIRGDGVMAVFGAPKPMADPARAAWSALVDMARGLERLNAQLATEGHAPLAIAIGAAYGEGVVGHVGGRERFNYTAIGNAANLAARLESESKRLGFTAVVTQDIARAADGESLEAVGTLELKGLEPVEAWGWRWPAAGP
jgi:adenylate cyclase